MANRKRAIFAAEGPHPHQRQWEVEMGHNDEFHRQKELEEGIKNKNNNKCHRMNGSKSWKLIGLIKKKKTRERHKTMDWMEEMSIGKGNALLVNSLS
jgi:hypothetical protein